MSARSTLLAGLAGLAACAALVAAPAGDARAQMADAIGKPLPLADLPAGTVTVRVVEGEMSKPAPSVDVRLTVDGEDRIARTDAAGRATFPGVPVGATVKAATAGADGADVTSVEFPLPDDRGVALLLSTVPFRDTAAAPMGAGGRPPPRMMAGQARPERTDPAGQVTVRLSYNDWDDTTALGEVPVVLVAYAADDRVAAKVVNSDAAGRAVVPGLDTTGSTAYYALALLDRDGADDRLMSLPITPSPEVGLRVALSGEKRGSGAPPVDDLERFVPQPTLPAGQVVVVFAGELPPRGTEVELLDITKGEVIAKTQVDRGRPVPSTIDAKVGDAVARDDLAAGTVQVKVQVQGLGLPRAPVLVRAVDAAPDGTRFEAAGRTDDDGVVTVTGAPAGVPLVVALTVEGAPFSGAPFTLEPARGAAIDVTASFELLSALEAGFAGVSAGRDTPLLAQTTINGQRYRTPPFLLGTSRGVVVPMFVLPRVQLSFQLDAVVDDEYLATRGTWILQNASWAPWVGPSEGLRMPAPKGATGLVVADEDKTWVSADGDAFRLLRPLPPLGGQFRAGFSLKIDDGEIAWDLPLPLGATKSSMAIKKTPRMKVVLPPRTQGRDVPQPDGSTWLAITNIDIPANQRMVFSLSGMPERPAWEGVARLAAGFAALLLIGAGIWFGFGRAGAAVIAAGARGGPAAAAAAATAAARKQRRKRIDALLDDVAALDRAARTKSGDEAASADRRAALVAELEALYREEDAAKGG